ncbi:MAG: WYL domain-containing protein [Gloeomargarita sp. SKYG116]|nr:WYL domain-containing protein [Gloeomargarita sp. SKYG116]MDW8400190.1 WYL domain-containing protein [Gloeomargarita sp. SKYGB_i_bin116]
MLSKNDNNYNSLKFILELLRLLAEKPRRRQELVVALGDFLEGHGQSTGDLEQKIVRVIRKLRDCGFQIRSGPHRPYELVASAFPVLLSAEQRQALALGAYLLETLGFSREAHHVLQVGRLRPEDFPPALKTDFSPPVDYSEAHYQTIRQQLEERIHQRRRFAIAYRPLQGDERLWDCDCSELRLHNGVLYLFTWVPTPPIFLPRRLPSPSVEENFTLRVDRIVYVGPASGTPWQRRHFPTLTVRYRLKGELARYQPRRAYEQVVVQDPDGQFVEIKASVDCLFWFRQRLLQYGANAQVLEPAWLAQDLRQELQRAYQSYGNLSH